MFDTKLRLSLWRNHRHILNIIELRNHRQTQINVISFASLAMEFIDVEMNTTAIGCIVSSSVDKVTFEKCTVNGIMKSSITVNLESIKPMRKK